MCPAAKHLERFRGPTVSARELAEPYPHVGTDDDARDAARRPVERRLPALLVVDREGRPYAAVPGPQLIGPLLPPDALTDPRYGAGLDARHLDGALERLAGLTVAEWLPRHRTRPPAVTTEASATHVATLMARTHTPWSPWSSATAAGTGSWAP